MGALRLQPDVCHGNRCHLDRQPRAHTPRLEIAGALPGSVPAPAAARSQLQRGRHYHRHFGLHSGKAHDLCAGGIARGAGLLDPIRMKHPLCGIGSGNPLRSACVRVFGASLRSGPPKRPGFEAVSSPCMFRTDRRQRRGGTGDRLNPPPEARARERPGVARSRRSGPTGSPRGPFSVPAAGPLPHG